MSRALFDLSDRVEILTGASAGIGRMLAGGASLVSTSPWMAVATIC
jgi:hypothetical protein